MARPRKNPDDPKWSQRTCSRCGEVNPAEIHTCSPQVSNEDWKMYFAAALTGLIARGGFSSEQMIKTAKQYADDAVRLL